MSDMAAIARLLGEPARMAMLEALLDGSTQSGRELAKAASMAPSTASEHLAQLQDAGLVTAAPNGRKRAYSLSGPPVAEALEALGALAPPKPPRSLREATARRWRPGCSSAAGSSAGRACARSRSPTRAAADSRSGSASRPMATAAGPPDRNPTPLIVPRVVA